MMAPSFLKPKVVFSDFDGTLTFGNDLTREFFEVLDILSNANIPLVIVTGRSVSWAHFLLTHFHYLNYVIAEGGGVLVRRGEGDGLINDFLVSKKDLSSLADFTNLLETNFSDICLSADSLGRVSDRAIELEEFTGRDNYKRDIETLMDKHQINYSTSSVHLNFWKSDISKYLAVTYFLKKYYKGINNEDLLYFGDSFNDQSMFRMLEHSVGVSNIKDCLSTLKYRPSVILEGDANIGVSGVIRYLKGLIE